jgi:hypothetical protein
LGLCSFSANPETPKLLVSTRDVFVHVVSASSILPTSSEPLKPDTAVAKERRALFTHTNDAMWFKKKREGDIETEALRGQRKDTTPEDTEYRPINWKKILLSPKYIRMLRGRVDARPYADKRYSMARHWYLDHRSHRPHHY